MELEPETTIILREIRAIGNEVHVSVEDILGTAVGRVHAFANPNSSYRLQTPGGQTVALIRGSFARMTVFDSGSVRVTVGDCTRVCEIQYQGRELFKDTGGASFGITSTGTVTRLGQESSLDVQDPDPSRDGAGGRSDDDDRDGDDEHGDDEHDDDDDDDDDDVDDD